MTARHTASLLAAAAAELGEGAIWDERDRALWWVDITRGALHHFDPATGRDHVLALPPPLSAVIPRRCGGVVVALRDTIVAIDPQSREQNVLARAPAAGHSARHRFNDGKCDPAGRFWIGSMDTNAAPGAGKLYRLDPDHRLHPIVSGVTVSNGIVWSSDAKTMYYIDSPTREVVAFEYEVTSGALGRKRRAVSVGPEMGLPDGMAIDSKGMLWVAHWGGWCVRRWNPRDGALLEEVAVPVAQVTSCAFGGPELDQLYITTARSGLNPEQLREQPLAGGLFVYSRRGLRGVPAVPFAD